MSTHVVVVDLFALALMALGFCMVFRQSFVRRMLRWSVAPGKTGAGGDPATYGLRIAGTMIMVFGLALGMMVTLLSLA